LIIPGESLGEIEGVIQETEREWSSFEADIKAEINYLEFFKRLKSTLDLLHGAPKAYVVSL